MAARQQAAGSGQQAADLLEHVAEDVARVALFGLQLRRDAEQLTAATTSPVGGGGGGEWVGGNKHG